MTATTTPGGSAPRTDGATDGATSPVPRSARIGPFRLRRRPRPVIVGAVLVVLCVVIGVVALCVGELVHGPQALLDLIGGHAGRLERTVVRDWRGSRVVLGLGVGACLGLAGALCQTVTRNPLATPDILGVSAGAAAGAVIALVAAADHGLSGLPVPIAALLGAIVAAGVVALGALRAGVDPLRVVLVGVAVNAGLGAVTDYVLVTARSTAATEAQTWLAGSLESADWGRATTVAVVGGLVLAGTLVLARRLEPLDLDDTTARSIGASLVGIRVAALCLAVVATAVAVSASGPIAFVAFAAPLVARALSGSPVAPFVSAATGATLVVGADLIARTVLPWAVPVGLVTAGLGAPLLVVTVIRQSSKGR